MWCALDWDVNYMYSVAMTDWKFLFKMSALSSALDNKLVSLRSAETPNIRWHLVVMYLQNGFGLSVAKLDPMTSLTYNVLF